jgi:hypothetical protein
LFQLVLATGCGPTEPFTDEAAPTDDAGGASFATARSELITYAERLQIGRIYDTGASMGFAEFFASLVNWSSPNGSQTEVDYGNMNSSLTRAQQSLGQTRWTGSLTSCNPSEIAPMPRSLAQPHPAVQCLRNALYTRVANTSSYGDYYDLAASLAIAEGQAYLAQVVGISTSWQFCRWALDTALYRANRLQGRVSINISALESLRADLYAGNVTNAYGRIQQLRAQYADAVYTSAEGPACGDNQCQSGESCSSCSADCGTCPNGPCNGQPANEYYFCLVCPNSWGSYSATTVRQTACTYQIARDWVVGLYGPNCQEGAIYDGRCN